MLFNKCKNCQKKIWFFQKKCELELIKITGERKIIHLCFECGIKIAEESSRLRLFSKAKYGK